MRINDILDAVNTVIDIERVVKGIKARGHFVSTIEIKKSIGPYKKACIRILYVDVDNNTNTIFVATDYTDRTLTENIDKFILIAEKQAMVKFITICHESDNWNKLIEGKYGTE